jgi:hypothetical protein
MGCFVSTTSFRLISVKPLFDFELAASNIVRLRSTACNLRPVLCGCMLMQSTTCNSMLPVNRISLSSVCVSIDQTTSCGSVLIRSLEMFSTSGTSHPQASVLKLYKTSPKGWHILCRGRDAPVCESIHCAALEGRHNYRVSALHAPEPSQKSLTNETKVAGKGRIEGSASRRPVAPLGDHHGFRCSVARRVGILQKGAMHYGY